MDTLTIDDMIELLIIEKGIHGGDAKLFVKDADTRLHMPVVKIRESNNDKRRILIIHAQYSEI